MENRIYTTSGISFSSLLTILFIGLKLGNVINWSWWWVLSPLWLPSILLTFGIALFVVLYIIVVFIKNN